MKCKMSAVSCPSMEFRYLCVGTEFGTILGTLIKRHVHQALHFSGRPTALIVDGQRRHRRLKSSNQLQCLLARKPAKVQKCQCQVLMLCEFHHAQPKNAINAKRCHFPISKLLKNTLLSRIHQAPESPDQPWQPVTPLSHRCGCFQQDRPFQVTRGRPRYHLCPS